jgi:hypothetical protein
MVPPSKLRLSPAGKENPVSTIFAEDAMLLTIMTTENAAIIMSKNLKFCLVIFLQG